MDVACANSFVVYKILHPNDLTLLDFKTIIATYLIGRYTSRSRAPPEGKIGSKRKYQYEFEPNHAHSICQNSRVVENAANIATKRVLNGKSLLNAPNIEFSCV